MATYTFTLRSGVTLSQAAVMYGASTYDIDAALTAGGGTITTTNDTLAELLRGVLRSDGLPLLLEAGVILGPADNPLIRSPRRVFLNTAATEPDGMYVGDLLFVTDPTSGNLTDIMVKTA
jgi:hypothetical protein